jgi:hypothetical protein
MVDAPSSDIAELVPRLVVRFQTEKSVLAADVGELIKRMASDYGKVARGRTLVIAHLRTGSLFAVFTDLVVLTLPALQAAAEISKAGESILKFAIALKSVIDQARQSATVLNRRGRAAPGVRSVEQMMEIAAKTGSYLTIHEETRAGAKLTIKLDPTEAIRIGEENRTLREIVKKNPSKLSGNKIASFIDFQALNQRSMGDQDEIVNALVSLLIRTGNERLVDSLVAELQSRGLVAAAQRVRDFNMRRLGREPPPRLR